MTNLKHLFCQNALNVGSEIMFDKDMSKRLSRVLRMKEGEKIALFNSVDGLFEVEICGEKCTSGSVVSQLKDLGDVPQVYLLMSMVKKDAMDRIFRQATEFGITDIIPICTDFTVVDKLNEDRVNTLLVEASEQCERLTLPKLHPIMPLAEAIKLPKTVFWCAEHVGGKWHESTHSGGAILIGPEGGFSEKERALLASVENVKPVGLGNHILRADTAAVAAFSRFFEYLA